MGMEQMDMFSFVDNLNKDPITNTTCVVMDGECKDVAWNELFDAEKYDQLMCVTYVSSASFLSRAIDKFKNVKVIIGIEKADVRKAIAESINARVMQEGTNFYGGNKHEEDHCNCAGHGHGSGTVHHRFRGAQHHHL